MGLDGDTLSTNLSFELDHTTLAVYCVRMWRPRSCGRVDRQCRTHALVALATRLQKYVADLASITPPWTVRPNDVPARSQPFSKAHRIVLAATTVSL